MPRNEQKFSLKDHLFNKEKVAKITKGIKAVYPTFKEKQFKSKVLKEFPKLELLERVYWIRDCLREFLPGDYRAAVKILLESLPPPCDPSLSDDDFGDYIYAPYTYFVAEYGCTKKDLSFSFKALKQLTTRFSVEAAIRFFLNEFPEETLNVLKVWSKDKHYHVRRAASEGTRPKLPWAQKIQLQVTDPLPLLHELYKDKTRYVTRSVANHVNDISKLDTNLAIKLLKQWQKEGKQEPSEMDYITGHSLRTLVKQGNQEALKLLGYNGSKIMVKDFKINTPKVEVGETLEFSFDIVSKDTEEQSLMIDYILYFNKANGQPTPKVHKIAKKTIKAGETITINKNHPLRVMTTRKLYPGQHAVELQINGKSFGKKPFMLK